MVVRIILIVFLAPATQGEWFVPFITNFIDNPTIDPWNSHIADGGDELAFPYGPVMWLILIPTTALGALAGLLFPGSDTTLTAIGFSTGVIVLDFLLLLAILKIMPGRRKLVIWLYWLSPIVLYVNYWHGQIDVVPILLLTTSLVALRKQKYKLAGAILGACLLYTSDAADE